MLEEVVGFVRKLEVVVPMQCVLDGTAHRQLLEYMGDIKCLPSANKLCIFLRH
ncbi:hypothetical protein LPJ60_006000, partial [Coemansia sp. RSA 2675]